MTDVSDTPASSSIDSKPEPSQILMKYVAENPLKVLSSLVLSSGGLLLLMYFGRIRFMPDLSIESATSLLYAVALLGLFITAYISLTMVLPGLILYWSREHYKGVGKGEVLNAVGSATAIWFLTGLGLFEVFPPWNAWYWCATLLCLLASGWNTARLGKSKAPGAVASVEGAQPTNGQESASAAGQQPPATGTSNRSTMGSWIWGTATPLILAVVTSFPVLFFFMFGTTGDIKTAPALQIGVALIVMVICLMGAALLVDFAAQERNYRAIVFIAIGLFVLLLLSVGNVSSVGMLPVKLLGQGEVETARIVVSAAGCKEINLALGENVCRSEKDDAPAAICPVMLRSRIGSQAVLEFAPVLQKAKDDAIGWALVQKIAGTNKERHLIRRVVIDKTRLLSWQPLDALPEVTTLPDKLPDRPPLAKWVMPDDDGRDVLGNKNQRIVARLRQLCAPLPSAAPAVPAASAASAASGSQDAHRTK